MPARVLLQDFTGVPAVVDLAAMRDAMAALGGDPAKVNPLVPADLVIDHSVQVDASGRPARSRSTWSASTSATASATSSCAGRRPRSATCGSCRPGTGIVHQVNLEYLATVVTDREDEAAAGSPSRTRWSGPTRTPRWSTGSACSATASADRGRGRAPRPAALPADATDRRRAPLGDLPRVDGDRPRAGHHRDAPRRSASSARSSSSPATASPACRSPTARRSPT